MARWQDNSQVVLLGNIQGYLYSLLEHQAAAASQRDLILKELKQLNEHLTRED